MRFASPTFLFLLAVIPLMLWCYFRILQYRTAKLKYSSLEIMKGMRHGDRSEYKHFRPLVRVAAVFLLILALARPQAGQKGEEITARGTDILLCLDTSTSMRAEDFKPLNRLDAAKRAAKEFVNGRKHDRIGVVVFSAMSFTQCPLTVDYGAVNDFLDKIEIGMTQRDGTAIGTAIATCVNRLKDSTVKSKTVVLLTDGRNNTGEIDPFTAAETAKAMDIRIYTIGAGVPGGAMYPYDDPIFGKRYVKLQEELDEDTLAKIASLTGGRYFRATSAEGLKSIYRKIDEMEKTDIKVSEYTDYTELFPYFIFPALLLFAGEILLANTFLRKLP